MKLSLLNTKKSSISFVITTTTCILFVFCSQRQPAEKTPHRLSLEQVHEDFSEMTKKIEQNIPEPYYHCSKERYDSVKSSIYNTLRDGMTIHETYRAFYPLVQHLNDAHFSIHLPDQLIMNENISYFPLRIIIEQDKLYVLEDLSTFKQIGKGEEIKFINNISVKDILKKIKGTDYREISDLTFFAYRTEAVFHKRLYPLFGFNGTFTIKTADKIYHLNGIQAERFEIDLKESFEFKILEPEIGYLKINNLVYENPEQRDQLKKALDQHFKTLRIQSFNKLIVDIRGNLGGSSVLAKDILDYFANTPYTLAAGVDYLHQGKPRYAAVNQMHNPTIGENKYRGNVVLISDVLTYSSAHMMQVGFKYYNMGVTIGQKSSESLYITGEVKQHFLKNSKIELIAPTVNFHLPGYVKNHTEYYIPDHMLYPSVAERLQEKDIFLHKAIDILK